MQRNSIHKRSNVIESFTVFTIGTVSWIAAILYIELAPKNFAYRDTLRLVYTIGYFLCALGLLRHLRNTVPVCVASLFRWRYEGAPLGMEHAWKNLLEECSFILCTVVWIFTLLFACTGISVIENWFPIPWFLECLNEVLWWGSLVTLIVFVYWFPASLDNMFKHFRFLRRQIETCDFYRPRAIADLWELNPNAPDPAHTPRPPDGGFVVGNRPWTFSALTENLIAFGSTGSGKTICVMNAFLRQFIASTNLKNPAGGLILDYKGDYGKKLKCVCQEFDRTCDLIVLSPTSHQKWNPLDSNESASEIASRFVATMKALGQKDHQTSFFADAVETYLEHAITLLRHCNRNSGPPTIVDIYRLANELPFLDERIEMLPESFEGLRRTSAIARCKSFFESEFYSSPEDTRLSVLATLNNMLNPLCNDLVSSIIDGPSTIDLAEAASGGKLIYLQLPSSKTPKAGRVLGLLLKLAFFAEVRKKTIEGDDFSFFFADEFQEFFTSEGEAGDPRFFAVSREFRHCNIVATQNLNNFTMQGDKKDAVMSLLGNIKTKVFLQNSDQQTNEYASHLFGTHLAVHGGAHIGGQAQIIPNLTPSDFISLRTPEKPTCEFCDSYVLIETGSRVDIANRTNRWPVCPIPHKK